MSPSPGQKISKMIMLFPSRSKINWGSRIRILTSIVSVLKSWMVFCMVFSAVPIIGMFSKLQDNIIKKETQSVSYVSCNSTICEEYFVNNASATYGYDASATAAARSGGENTTVFRRIWSYLVHSDSTSDTDSSNCATSIDTPNATLLDQLYGGDKSIYTIPTIATLYATIFASDRHIVPGNDENEAILRLEIDTSNLQAGQNYDLCVDYDGYGGVHSFQDSGLDVFVGGPYAFGAPFVFQSTTEQNITISCHPGTCNETWMVYAIQGRAITGTEGGRGGYQQLWGIDLRTNESYYGHDVFGLTDPNLGQQVGFCNRTMSNMAQEILSHPYYYSTGSTVQKKIAPAVNLNPLSHSISDYTGGKYIDNEDFSFTLNTSELEINQFYSLCIDPDGNGDLKDADPLLSFYLGGMVTSENDGGFITASPIKSPNLPSNIYNIGDNVDSNFVINNLKDAHFDFDCFGCFAQFPTAYIISTDISTSISVDCISTDILSTEDSYNGTVEDSGMVKYTSTNTASSPIIGTGSRYRINLNAENLIIGQMYTLCIDFDGEKLGAHFVEAPRKVIVSPVTQLVMKFYNKKIQFYAVDSWYTFTTANSLTPTAHLAGSCDPDDVDGINVGSNVDPKSTDHCELSYIVPGAGQSFLPYWECTFTGNQIGSNYLPVNFGFVKICLDTDGIGTNRGSLEISPPGGKLDVFTVTSIGQDMLNPVSGAISLGSSTTIGMSCGSSICLDGVMMGLLVLDRGLDYSQRQCPYTVFDGNYTADGIYNTIPVVGYQASLSNVYPVTGTSDAIVFTFDTTNLLGGGRYKVCADYDGKGLDFHFGELGHFVYANPVTQQVTTGIFMETNQYIDFVCPTCIAKQTLAYLAVTTVSKNPALHDEPCDVTNYIGTTTRFGNFRTESFPLEKVSDASAAPDTFRIGPILGPDLSYGQNYKLCLDLDGTAISTAVGYTGIRIYVSPATRVKPRAIFKDILQAVTVYCCCCNPNNDRTEVYLARVCNTLKIGAPNVAQFPPLNTESSLMADGTSDPVDTGVLIKADVLNRGENYNLCLDVDGGSYMRVMGDTTIDMYINAITEYRGTYQNGIKKTTNQVLYVTCPHSECEDGVTTVYLRRLDLECDLISSDGYKAEDAPWNSASANITLIAGETTKFTITVDATNLSPGYYYKICSDLDGSGPLFWGDTGYDVYISPFATLTSEGAVEKAAYTQTSNQLYATCLPGTNCISFMRAHLDIACDSEANTGITTPVTGDVGSDWNMDVTSTGIVTIYLDASDLTVGKHYVICLDYDGYATLHPWGDSTFVSYVRNIKSALNGVRTHTGQTSTLFKATAQSAALECTSNTDGDASTLIYITSQYNVALPRVNNIPDHGEDVLFINNKGGCDISINNLPTRAAIPGISSKSTNFGGVAPNFIATIDTSDLTTGLYYHICIDKDGSGGNLYYGDTGFKYFITPIIKSETNTDSLSNSRIIFDCEDCINNITMLYLTFSKTSECPNWQPYIYGFHNDTLINDHIILSRNDHKTIYTVALRDNTYLHHNYRYESYFNNSNLLIGAHYWLCLDRDGIYNIYPFGNSGYKIYITPIKVQFLGVIPPSNPVTFDFLCDKCSINSYVYLTRILGNNPPALGCLDQNTGTTIPVQNDGSEHNQATQLTQTIRNIGTNKYTYNGAANQLNQGELFTLCIDLDGDQTTFFLGATYGLNYGDSGGQIFIGVIFNLIPRRYIPSNTFVQTKTGFGGETTASRLYLTALNTECDVDIYRGNLITPIDGVRTGHRLWTQPLTNYWGNTFDMTKFIPGMLYRMCHDMDGNTQERHYVDTFTKLYILDIDIVTPGIVTGRNQKIVVNCPDCIHNLTSMYITSSAPPDKYNYNGGYGDAYNPTIHAPGIPIDLPSGSTFGYGYRGIPDGSIDCDFSVFHGYYPPNPPTNTESVLLLQNTDNGIPIGMDGAGIPILNQFVGIIDASEITSGGRYFLCIDLDGANKTLTPTVTAPYMDSFAFGYTELGLYITGVTVDDDIFVYNEENTIFRVNCKVCNTSTTGYLSTIENGCDISDNDAGQQVNGELQSNAGNFYIANNPLSPGYPTVAYFYDPTDHSNAIIVWNVTINALGLKPGDYYGLCSDMDGTITTLATGDTQQFIYVAPRNMSWRSDIILNDGLGQVSASNITNYGIINYGTNIAGTIGSPSHSLVYYSDSASFGNIYAYQNQVYGKKITSSSLGDLKVEYRNNHRLSYYNNEFYISNNAVITIKCPHGCINGVTIAYFGVNCKKGATHKLTEMNTIMREIYVDPITGDTKFTSDIPPGEQVQDFITGETIIGNALNDTTTTTGVFQIIMDTTPLEAGNSYKLCLIVENGDSPGWSGMYAWFNPIIGQEPRNRVVQKGSNQYIYFECPSCQNGVTTAYLAQQHPTIEPCKTWESNVLSAIAASPESTLASTVYKADENSRVTVLLTTGNGISIDGSHDFFNNGNLMLNDTATYYFIADLSVAIEGAYYKICMDIDGPGPNFYGDTKTVMFLSPILMSSPTLLNAQSATAQKGEVYCITCKSLDTRCDNSTDPYTNQTISDCRSDWIYTWDNIGVTSGYLSTSLDCVERNGTVDAILNNQTASTYMQNKTSILPYRFDFVWDDIRLDTNGFHIGQHLFLCIDMDGSYGPKTYGYSGIHYFLSSFTKLENPQQNTLTPTFFPAENQTLFAYCNSDVTQGLPGVKYCEPGITTGYLRKFEWQWENLCASRYSNEHSIGESNQDIQYPVLDGTIASPIVASKMVTGLPPQSDYTGDLQNLIQFTFDASQFSPGETYRLCIDYNGGGGASSSGSGVNFGDTGLVVYVTGVIHLVTTGLVIGGSLSYYDVAIICINTGSPCSTASMAYLSTECDNTVQNSVPTNNIAASTEVVPFMLSFNDKTTLTTQIQATLLSAGGGDTSSDFSNSSFSSLTSTYVNTTFDSAAVLTTLLGQAYNGTYFILRLNTRYLVDGFHFQLCTDLDGYSGSQFLGDSGFSIYTAKIPFIDDTRIHAKGPVAFNLTCLGCTNSTEAYLLNSVYGGICSMTKSDGSHEKNEWSTNSIGLSPFYTTESIIYNKINLGGNSANHASRTGTFTGVLGHIGQLKTYDFGIYKNQIVENMYVFNFHTDMIEDGEGYEYRLCIDLNVNSTNYKYGDVGLKIYITPVTHSDISVISTEGGGGETLSWVTNEDYTYTRLKFSCGNCTEGKSIAFLSENCRAEGNIEKFLMSGAITHANITLASNYYNTQNRNLLNRNPFNLIRHLDSDQKSWQLYDPLTQSDTIGARIQDDEFILTQDITNASYFITGKTYELCIDLDGFDSFYYAQELSSTSLSAITPTGLKPQVLGSNPYIKPLGYSGYSVFFTPIDYLLTLSIYAGINQVIYFHCIGKCLPQTTGFLSDSFGECNNVLENSIMMTGAAQYGDGYWALTGIDARNLHLGREYAICIDIDGEELNLVSSSTTTTSFSYGLTGFRVSIHPIESLPIKTITYKTSMAIGEFENLEIKICSSKCEAQADYIHAFLSHEDCKDVERYDYLRPITKTFILKTSSYRYYIPIDSTAMSRLQLGKRANICTMINSTQVTATFLNDGSQPFTIDQLNSTIIVNTQVQVFVNFAYEFSSYYYYSAIPQTVYSFSQLIDHIIGGPGGIINSETGKINIPLTQEMEKIWTGQGFSFFNDFNNISTSGFQNLTLEYGNLTSSLNLTLLSDYIDPNITQRVYFKCDSCTISGQSAIYIGKFCMSTITDGIIPAIVGVSTKSGIIYNDKPSSSLPATDASWYADIGFGFLTSGVTYKVCLDYDRFSTQYGFEESGTNFIITGITGSLNSTLFANSSQMMTVTCNTCQSGKTRAYLNFVEDNSPIITGIGFSGETVCRNQQGTLDGAMRRWKGKRTPAATLNYWSYNWTNTFNSTLFNFYIDAQTMPSNAKFMLCVDEDGGTLNAGFADTGLIFTVK